MNTIKKSPFTDLEALVLKAKAKEGEAAQKLIMAFGPLIWSLIDRYVYDKSDYEDAYQDACCTFLTAIQDFSLEVGVYFQVFIKSRLTHYFQKRREDRFNRSLKADDSLDRVVQGKDGAIALMALIIDEQTNLEATCILKEQLMAQIASLTPGQKEILCYKASGQGTLKAYAKQKNISPAAASRLYSRGINKLLPKV